MNIGILVKALNDLAKECYSNAASKGFHEEDDNPHRFAEYIANLHGEVSELWEAHRKGALHDACNKVKRMEELGIPGLTNAEEEIADIIIRALDTAEGIEIKNIGLAIQFKMAYNRTRPYMHGKKC